MEAEPGTDLAHEEGLGSRPGKTEEGEVQEPALTEPGTQAAVRSMLTKFVGVAASSILRAWAASASPGLGAYRI